DDAFHARLVVARNETGELERAGLGKVPENLAGSHGLDPFAVDLIVLHLRVFLHLAFVLGVVLDGIEQELMRQISRVPEHKPDLLSSSYLDPVQAVAHRAGPLRHHDLDRTERFLWVTWLSGSERVLGVRRRAL